MIVRAQRLDLGQRHLVSWKATASSVASAAWLAVATAALLVAIRCASPAPPTEPPSSHPSAPAGETLAAVQGDGSIAAAAPAATVQGDGSIAAAAPSAAVQGDGSIAAAAPPAAAGSGSVTGGPAAGTATDPAASSSGATKVARAEPVSPAPGSPASAGAAEGAAAPAAGPPPASSVSAAPIPPAPEGPWSGWKTLTFEARQMLFFYGRVEMSRRTEGDRIILQTRTTATFMGASLVETHTTSVMDARTGAALEYWELSSHRGRHYVFSDGGYTVQRLRPPKEGLDAPPQQWTAGSTRRFPAAAPATAGAIEAPAGSGPAGVSSQPLHDPYGMLLQLGRQDLERPGDEVVLTVATAHGPEAYRIHVAETRQSQRSVRDARTNAPIAREPIRELRVRVTPAHPNPDDEGFMKMEGETEIWVEARSRTLLEVDGRIPHVPGRVEVVLSTLGR